VLLLLLFVVLVVVLVAAVAAAISPFVFLVGHAVRVPSGFSFHFTVRLDWDGPSEVRVDIVLTIGMISNGKEFCCVVPLSSGDDSGVPRDRATIARQRKAKRQ
jgi:hypothetical protein